MSDELKVWHFAGKTLRDGAPLTPKGETISVKGPIIPCSHGLHGSVRAIDALVYAPGLMVARCTLHGDIKSHGNPADKHAARSRTCDSGYVNVRSVVVEFTRLCALQATRVYAANALMIAGLGDEANMLATLQDGSTAEEIADAARAAARVATRVARDARTAWDAAWLARDARDAWAAARAAMDAAGAAWDAARAARDARDAAWLVRAVGASRAAVMVATDARAAAGAARDAAWVARLEEATRQNTLLEKMLMEVINNG